jgi:hypothetical protein
MNDVSMDAHAPEAGGHGDGLVGDHPDLPRKTIHFHGESHGGVDCPDGFSLQDADDFMRHLVDVVAGVVELEIGHRPRRTTYGLAVHSADETQ